jgi:3-mercaptopyruvate sulfurtransferase SseA
LAERNLYVKEMNAGWHEWVKEGLPTEKGAASKSTVA